MVLKTLGRAVEVYKTEGATTFAKKTVNKMSREMRPSNIYWRHRAGTNVYETDWELLVVLDACRYDALLKVKDEYEFLKSIEPTISVGPGTPAWMSNTFIKPYFDEMNKTAYISGSPYTRSVLGPPEAGSGPGHNVLDEFEALIPVWESGWSRGVGTVPAREVTDHVIEYLRNNETSRTIAHYMQPHFPSVPDSLGSELDIDEEASWVNSVWERLERNELCQNQVWTAYIENLRYVLDDVALLLENAPVEDIVITADHGNAFGERGEYGHGYDRLRVVREVPFARVSATDTGTYGLC